MQRQFLSIGNSESKSHLIKWNIVSRREDKGVLGISRIKEIKLCWWNDYGDFPRNDTLYGLLFLRVNLALARQLELEVPSLFLSLGSLERYFFKLSNFSPSHPSLSLLLARLSSHHPQLSKYSPLAPSSNGIFSVSSFLPSYLPPLFRLSTSPPFGFHWSPLMIQGFRSIIAWDRALIWDFFQHLHPDIVLSPQICVLCFPNLEWNNDLLVHCPSSWLLWEILFNLINLYWVVPIDVSSLVFQWRALHLPSKTQKLWNLCLHALLWSIWKEKTELFDDSFRDMPFVWYHFLFLVVSWAKLHCTFSRILFVSFTCNMRSLLLLQEIPL